jgi:1,2-phenylacetyl-CoA epoxidase catalytic subunit
VSSEKVSERVRVEWCRRIEAEYRSAAVTQHLTLWLIQIGASPDLIHAGLRITKDELEHARLSHKVAVAAGAKTIVIDREQLALESSSDREIDLLRACVGIFCLGETVAVPLFAALRAECTVPVAKKALDRILKDEVRHRDFGWTLLGWLLEQDRRRREMVQSELPRLLDRARANYGEVNEPKMSKTERAWGLMPSKKYREILEKTFVKDYRPRFAKLALTI